MEPTNKDKVIESLIESIDIGEHNDVDIILEDGMISASKLILSSRSEYFQKMFNKNSQFEEQRSSSVNFPCKKVIMQKILEHLYGGNLVVSGLTCLEMIELLNMLRLLLLEETFISYEDYLVEQLCAKNVPINECLDAVEMANSLKFETITNNLLGRITSAFGLLLYCKSEDLEKLSVEIVVKMMSGIFISERSYAKPPEIQMQNLKFFHLWLSKNRNLLTEGQKKEIILGFDLSKFSVKQLLSEVRNTRFFNDVDIFAAVNIVHDKVREELNEVRSDYDEMYNSNVDAIWNPDRLHDVL